MNLTTFLGLFDEENLTYNGFSSKTFADLRSYCLYLDNLSNEYFSEIKNHIAKVLLKENPLPTIKLFLDSKFFDFEEVKRRLESRDLAINEQRNRHRIAIVMHDFGEQRLSERGIAYATQVAANLRLIQDYYENNLSFDTLSKHLLAFEKEFLTSEMNNVYISTLMEKCQRDCIDQSINRLNELYNSYFSKDSEVNDAQTLEEKTFKDYLFHNNKDALLQKLHELLDGKKGKVVVIAIKALEKLSFIAGYEHRATLYKAMRKEFGSIGTDTGLNDFYSNSHKILDSELNQYVDILDRVK